MKQTGCSGSEGRVYEEKGSKMIEITFISTGAAARREHFAWSSWVRRPRTGLAALTGVGCAVLALGSAPAFAGPSACPNAASRQGPSLNLPDCRAYEQVTPVDKGDAIDLFGEGGRFRPVNNNEAYVAENGEALLLRAPAAIGPTAPTTRAGYVFSRGAEGWKMQSVVNSAINAPQQTIVEVFDPARLSHVGFRDLSGSAASLIGGDEARYQGAHLTGPVGGPYASVSQVSGSGVGELADEAYMVGGAEDLRNVILESEDLALAPGAASQDAGSIALYESVGGEECNSPTSSCKLVDVDPETGSAFQCGAVLGQEPSLGSAHSAVSSDGSKVIFTAPDPMTSRPSGPGCWNPAATPQENPPEIYIREGGTRTVAVSLPQEGVAITPQNPLLPAVFVGASSDGSKVFFLTKTELTEGDTTHAYELYEYNVAPRPGEKRLTLISGGAAGTIEGNVDFVAAVSSDGSTVYFTAFGQLAAGAPIPSGGGVDLYRYHYDTDTQTETTTYVTEVNANDYPLAGHGGKENTSSWTLPELGILPNQGVDDEKSWYTTGEGQYLVFDTIRPITGYDNNKAQEAPPCISNYPGGAVPNECQELFRYDAGAQERGEDPIVCVSCAGGRPWDGAYFTRTGYESPAAGTPRPISENGEYVFFDSADALVPQATPGKVHVYEWHDGTISLISSPNDTGTAFFLGSSPDGANVFFSTHAQLVPQDTDQSADIYDARIDGGFAGVTAPQCTGTGCQGVPAAPPIFATPASVTFEGVGNFEVGLVAAKPKTKSKPAKCKRGYVKKKGRCVKRAKAKKAKKSTAKGRK